MKLNVIGLGYIGLPTALVFAKNGIEVIGTDYKKALVDTLNAGRLTFEEKGMDDLFKAALVNNIKFSTEYQKADCYIVSVPTPYDKISKKLDDKYVKAAVEGILAVCEKGSIIIVESTISPGTINKSIKPLIEKRNLKIGVDVHLAHAPERIIPGNMVYELEHNSRTIGADSKEIGNKIADFYGKITSGEVIVTDIKSAEMSKVVENTFRAVNIAFANELSKICRYDGMDVHEIIKICNMHPRVNILNPGPGVGGHCIPVDPWFLVGDYPTLTKVIWEALKMNESMPEYVLGRIRDVMDEHKLDDCLRVGLYGLSYKENVDDYRESPSIQILESQNKHLGIPLKVYDPFIKNDIVQNQYHNLKQFLNDVDFVVIMVKHNEIIENMDLLKDKIVLDTQNICHLKNVNRL